MASRARRRGPEGRTGGTAWCGKGRRRESSRGRRSSPVLGRGWGGGPEVGLLDFAVDDDDAAALEDDPAVVWEICSAEGDWDRGRRVREANGRVVWPIDVKHVSI